MLNIVTGEHGTSTVNVYDAVRIGMEQMDEFSRKLQDGFHNTVAVQAVSTAPVHYVCGPPTFGANTAGLMRLTVV